MSEPQKKKPAFKKVNMGDEEWKRIGRAFPIFSHWNYPKWKEWERSCVQEFGNIRWAKAMHDHEIVLRQRKEEAMFALILDLKKEVEVLKNMVNKPKDEQKDGTMEVKTFGDVKK